MAFGTGVPQDWRCPPESATEDRKLGWSREQRQQAESYLKGQRAYDNLDRAFDLIAGETEDSPRRISLSRVHYNLIKRSIQETVAAMSNLRPIWQVTTDNKEYYGQQAEILNKLSLGWWFNTFADRSIYEALQWAAVGGTGYCSPLWDKDFWVTGRGDIRLHTYGPRDILPIQIGRDHDLQKAYAVTLVIETPIAQAMAMYPQFADRLMPTRTRASYLRRGARAVGRFLSPALNLQPVPKKEDEEDIFPTIDIYYTYLLDLSINTSGHTMQMGDPGTSWEYQVPSLGSDLPTGVMDRATGQELVRKATFDDCLLYPLRRLMISTDTVVMKDGSSWAWHAKVPIVKFQFDDWPWEYLGYSLAQDSIPIQDSIRTGMRAIDDCQNVRSRPPMMYDESIAEADMNAFDPRVPLSRLKVNFNQMGDRPIRPIFEAAYYDIPTWMPEYIKANEERIKYLMGTSDVQALVRARQIPSSDSIEKLLELMGPIVQARSRNMERSMRDLAEMVKTMFFQFYSYPRRIQMVGPDGAAMEDFDYDPANLIPSHGPGEEPSAGPSRMSKLDRAKWHANNFFFHITPNSLHQITQLSRKMLYLQLQKSGFPIDPWTVAEALDLPNFGPPPQGTTNMLERHIAWVRMQAELAEELGIPPGGAKGKGGGRPSTGQHSPSMKNKPNGGGSTIRESR